jgi:hypothetical protein
MNTAENISIVNLMKRADVMREKYHNWIFTHKEGAINLAMIDSYNVYESKLRLCMKGQFFNVVSSEGCYSPLLEAVKEIFFLREHGVRVD